MITEKDLKERFHQDTGLVAKKNIFKFQDWIKDMYLQKLNEEKELRDQLEEFGRQFGVDPTSRETLTEVEVFVDDGE